MKIKFQCCEIRCKSLIIKILLLLVIIASVPWTSKAEMTVLDGESSICEELNIFLSDFVVDGVFARGELISSLPRISMNLIKEHGGYRMLRARIVDIDNDGDYEVIYTVSITSPLLVESKIYSLLNLSTEAALSLIENGRQSKFYSVIKKELEEKYQCDPMGIIVNAEPIEIEFLNFFSIEIEKNKEKVAFRTTPFICNDICYIVVEKFYDEQKELAVLSMIDAEKGIYQYRCKFTFN